jgi:DNA-binding beta-propeller fold protein YncE
MPGEQGCFRAGGGAGCGSALGTPRPTNVVVSPDGRFVFASSNGSAGNNGIAVFQRNTSTTDLTQGAPASACIRPGGASGCTTSNADPDMDVGIGSLAISPDGKHLYAAFDSAVQRFDVDQTTGALTQVAGTDGCISASGDSGACEIFNGLTFARSLAFSPDGKQLYVVSTGSNSLTILDRDPASGKLTPRTSASECFSATNPSCTNIPVSLTAQTVTVSPDGLNVYVMGNVADDRVVGFDRDSDGGLAVKAPPLGCNDFAGAVCQATSAFDSPRDFVVAADGRNAYAGTTTSDSLVIFDRELPPPAPLPPIVPAVADSAPKLQVIAAQRQRLGTLAVTVLVDEAAQINLTGRASVRTRKAKRSAIRHLPLRAVKRTLAANVRTRVRLTFSKKRLRTLRRALKRRARAIVSVTVKATDPAGNSTAGRARIRLRR